jgi:hypothetical protein
VPERSGSDVHRESIRGAVERIDAMVGSLAGQVTTAETRKTVQQLAESLSSLVSLLDLGTKPELQECPVCRRLGMRDATLCGYCWTKLVPPGPKPLGAR